MGGAPRTSALRAGREAYIFEAGVPPTGGAPSVCRDRRGRRRGGPAVERELTRTLGVSGIVLMVVAAAAPITVVVANFPIILMSAESVGSPLMVLAATVILLLFSVGYTWMAPHVPAAGAFYAYVHRGLGRRAGLGTAAIALLSYLLLTVAMTCYLGEIGRAHVGTPVTCPSRTPF